MSFGRASVLAAFVLSAVGCGSIEYGDDRAEPAPPPSQPATSGGATYVIAQAPTAPPPGGRVVVVPAPQQQVPAPPVVASPPPQPAPPAGAIVCSGSEHLRIDDRVIDGEEGAAIVASGNCVVEVSESIVRGRPAVHVSGNARVSLVECRVQGDLLSAGAARIQTRGTAHRGRVLHHAF